MAENKETPRKEELIEKYIFNLNKDQMKDRRCRTMLRVLHASGFISLIISFIILASNPSSMPWKSAKASEIMADTDHLIPSIQGAFDNPNSQAVILRINSPGGSPIQAGRIYEEVNAQRALHQEKKVYVIIDDIGASGLCYE